MAVLASSAAPMALSPPLTCQVLLVQMRWVLRPLVSPRSTGKIRKTFCTALSGSHDGCTPLACLFPSDFVRFLIFPNPEKDRLANAVVSRPFREFDLADHHRLNPNSNASSRRRLIPGPNGSSQPSGRLSLDTRRLLQKILLIKLWRLRGRLSCGFGRSGSLENRLAFHVHARFPRLGLCICNKPCHS
jgi:hypothetical protein